MSDRLADAIAELVEALREDLARSGRNDGASAPERLLSVDEAAAALGIGRTRLYAEMDAGRVRSVRAGRRRLIPTSAVAEYARRGA